LDAAATGGSCWMDLLRVGEPGKLLPVSRSRVGSWIDPPPPRSSVLLAPRFTKEGSQ